jgi:hypothetical protein
MSCTVGHIAEDVSSDLLRSERTRCLRKSVRTPEDIDIDCHDVAYDVRTIGRSSVSRSRIRHARTTPKKTAADESCCVEKE